MNLMRTSSRSFLVAVLALVVGLVTSCTDAEGPVKDNFDRTAMLTDITDNTIIPGYENLLASATTLQSAIDQFAQNPTPENLALCQQAWRKSALDWQSVVIFDFGPAEDLYGNLAENLSTFPVNESATESKIAAANHQHTDFARHTRGLYGMEYLLYCDAKGPVLSAFTGDSANLRIQYLQSIVLHFVSEVARVQYEWKNNYRAQFISQSGTDVGSGVGLLFNNLARGYELLKNYKIALPLGKIAGQQSTEPTKVEGFYSGATIELLNAHFDAVMNVWHGRGHQGAAQLGFRDYLLTVTGGQRLIDDTELQEHNVRVQLQQLGTEERLSTIIELSPLRIEPLQVETQKMTRFLKSEMSSLLGLSITFSSGDGD